GEEALEKPAKVEHASAPKKEPAAKRVKRDSPIEFPPSESEVDEGSEDEYVAESPKLKAKGASK
ncbi:hypothetical protein C0993_006985, partial [Termitomyces sp. T159_Od127]